MSAPGFIDTNVLIYAFADTADTRHETSRGLVEELIDGQSAVVSVQVLKEFYTVSTRKVKVPISPRDAVSLIRDLRNACRVMDDTVAQLDRALEISTTRKLSIWDASIISAAEAAGCSDIYTEDLASGARIGSIRITNPFD